jgi:hypothetical protein
VAGSLEKATGLQIVVQANGRDATGLLPAGGSDKGFLQLDDVELLVE